jgi:uncharacterized membrane protein
VGFAIQNFKKEIIMNKYFKYLGWFIILSPAAYLALVWHRLPDRIAIHFGLDGTPDRFGTQNSLLILVLVITSINLLAYLLLTNIHRIDSRKSATENRFKMERIGLAIAVFITVVLFIIINTAFSPDTKLSMRVIFAGIGLLFCLLGNYMYTIKPNYYAGIRLPWTLGNKENWRKTHLLAGKLFFIGGLLLALVCMLIPSGVYIIAFFLLLLIIIIVPSVYSYRLYKQHAK